MDLFSLLSLSPVFSLNFWESNRERLTGDTFAREVGRDITGQGVHLHVTEVIVTSRMEPTAFKKERFDIILSFPATNSIDALPTFSDFESYLRSVIVYILPAACIAVPVEYVITLE